MAKAVQKRASGRVTKRGPDVAPIVGVITSPKDRERYRAKPTYVHRMAESSAERSIIETPVGRVVLVQSGAWWAAELPAFPGAYGQGKTQRAAYVNLLGAIRDLAASYAEDVPKSFPSHLG